LKRDQSKTTLCGPFWTYFRRAHDIEINDVVKFKLSKLDESDDALAEGSYEIVDNDAEHVFDTSVVDPNNITKKFNDVPGMSYSPFITTNVHPAI
jgi:hypothetical protein